VASKRSSARVTLRDVAREAGVSIASASRALNGSDRTVRPEVLQRVAAAAERLKYVPNLSAQSMKRGASSTIGLVVTDIADPYFAAIASGVIGAAKQARMTVTIAAGGRTPEGEAEAAGRMRAQGHRAIIIAGSRHTSSDGAELIDQLQSFERSGGAAVMISQPTLPFATIALDNIGGARSLAMQLVGHGYRRFAILSGDRALATVADRIAGFRAGLAQLGLIIEDDDIVEGEFTRDGGYATARALLERGSDAVDLVFALNDVMAVGAMAALRDAGVSIGHDVGVAGFDDTRMARDVTPGLSTVSAPLTEMGALAVELALAGAGSNVVREVPSAGILRESTPPRRR
jgi:LacI family transcriptional regulator, galactose operon repressor